MKLTLKKHLENIRPKTHETQRKNGHFLKMVKARQNKSKKA